MIDGVLTKYDFRMRENRKNSCSSGIENLFYTPSAYRRVRYLTAGRHSFIIPGVMNEIDTLAACELQVPIVGESNHPYEKS